MSARTALLAGLATFSFDIIHMTDHKLSTCRHVDALPFSRRQAALRDVEDLLGRVLPLDEEGTHNMPDIGPVQVCSVTNKCKTKGNKMHADEKHPNFGPTLLRGLTAQQGVHLWDYEQIDFFSDRTTGSGTAHGPCTMRSCEGIDLVMQIQQDLRFWRQRGGICQADIDAAEEAGIPGAVRITIVNGELYARNFGFGWGVRDGYWLLVLLEMMEHFKWMFPKNLDIVLNPGDFAGLPKVGDVGHLN